MRKIVILILILVGIALLFGGQFVKKRFGDGDLKSITLPGIPVIQNEAEFQTQNNGTRPVNYKVETFIENLFVPWSIVFTSPDRLLVTERNGKIREIKNGQLQPEALITFSEVSTKSEEGLMGLTPDPDYQKNKTLYVCFAYQQGEKLFDKVVRLTDEGSKITAQETILGSIPAAQFHAGCRLRFGPDKKLYITTGDATDKNIAQDLNSLGGKILRINTDGSIPQDNPFTGSPVWSYGHRNPQGIDWHPVLGDLWETEHGPSGFDGAQGGDEVNLIQKGGNYGWPLVSHEKNQEGLIPHKLVFTPAEAPGSGMFYSENVFPQFKNNFFFGALRGEGIMRVVLSEQNPQVVIAYEKLQGVAVGRVREIVQGPDGFIYFSTSNRDGRGKINSGDDKIYRLVPDQ